MTFGKSASDKQAEAREARQRAEAATRERAAQEYAASPLGRAEAARERGDGFFQIHLPVTTLSGDRSWFGSSDNRIEPVRNVRRDGKPDILTQIEDVGWRLEHVGYVFVETGATTSGRMLTSGPVSYTHLTLPTKRI